MKELLSNFLTEVSVFIKKEKVAFAENYFRDKEPDKMSLKDRKRMYSDYNVKWEEKETALYELIAKNTKGENPDRTKVE